jgi:hypothetical protein
MRISDLAGADEETSAFSEPRSQLSTPGASSRTVPRAVPFKAAKLGRLMDAFWQHRSEPEVDGRQRIVVAVEEALRLR